MANKFLDYQGNFIQERAVCDTKDSQTIKIF